MVKQAAILVLDTVRTHPYAIMLAIFTMAILPGIVKLASMLPHTTH